MSTLKDTIEDHRTTGRGRKATWIALGVAALAVVIWSGSRVTGQEQNTRHSRLWGNPRGEHTPIDLARELREHSFWLARAGFAPAHTERLAALLDQRSPVFEAFESERLALTSRIVEVLAAPELDTAEVVTLRDEAKQLAADVVDASVDLVIDVAQDLTPEQRADLIRHWEGR